MRSANATFKPMYCEDISSSPDIRTRFFELSISSIQLALPISALSITIVDAFLTWSTDTSFNLASSSLLLVLFAESRIACFL